MTVCRTSARNTTCPECGAPSVESCDCRAQLEQVLAWEAQDAELASRHFLTVASFNLQHPASFTAAAVTVLRAAFMEHLAGSLPLPALRRRMGAHFEGPQRVLRAEAERRPVLHPWDLTFGHVYDGGNPQGAADRVTALAACIYATLQCTMSDAEERRNGD